MKKKTCILYKIILKKKVNNNKLNIVNILFNKKYNQIEFINKTIRKTIKIAFYKVYFFSIKKVFLNLYYVIKN